jgi:hypothetical protein
MSNRRTDEWTVRGTVPRDRAICAVLITCATWLVFYPVRWHKSNSMRLPNFYFCNEDIDRTIFTACLHSFSANLYTPIFYLQITLVRYRPWMWNPSIFGWTEAVNVRRNEISISRISRLGPNIKPSFHVVTDHCLLHTEACQADTLWMLHHKVPSSWCFSLEWPSI